jgi:hypothetical protein
MTPPGFPTKTIETVVTEREHSIESKTKLEALTDFLNKVLADDDVDTMFCTIMYKAKELGYGINDTPEAMIGTLNALAKDLAHEGHFNG